MENNEYNFNDESQKSSANAHDPFGQKSPFGNSPFGTASMKDLNFLAEKRYFKLAILFIAFLILYTYFIMPIYNFQYAVSIRFMMIIVLVFAFLLIKSKKRVLILIPVFLTIFIGLNIASSPVVNSDDYYNLIGEVETHDYATDPPPIDNEMIPVVDKELAKKLGDKVMGENVGLGSQYTVGEYYLVNTADDLAWVAPLEPRSFVKWFQNMEGSPGYVYVSATDPNDVRLVQEINGEPIHIKYTENSYFMSNIQRYTYFNGNMRTGLTDYSFEIDDEGNPYWVVTTYAPEIGIKGYDTSGVVLIDAQTGEMTKYTDISKAPEWVERVQPEEFIEQQVGYWGAYKNGFINTLLGQKEMIKATPGHSYVYIEGDPYYYTGLTSITSDESTVGFVTVNMRTKETDFYTLTGATENAAMSSAEGQVQQYGYTATYPILLNVHGKPTYFMTLKDADGLLKQYAFVSVENYNIVGVGTSIKEANTKYYDALKASGVETSDDTAAVVKVTGVIERINYVDNYYYIKLKDDNTIYQVAKEVAPSLVITQAGDNVALEVIEGEGDYTQVKSFKNNTVE